MPFKRTVTHPLYTRNNTRHTTMKNRFCYLFLIALTAGLATACIAPAAPEPNSTASSATKDSSATTRDEIPLTPIAIADARSIVWQADLNKYQALTNAEKSRNNEIYKILHDERIAALSPGLPAWVKDHLVSFEGENGDYGAAYSRTVAWGTGRYKNQEFYWFGHTNSDGWLQMDLSVALDQKDIDQIYGKKPDDLEGTENNPNRAIDVELVTPETTSAGVRGKTHIGTKVGVDWMGEFCVRPDESTCDTAGAMEKYLLPYVNASLPGLSAKLVARFPR